MQWPLTPFGWDCNETILQMEEARLHRASYRLPVSLFQRVHHLRRLWTAQSWGVERKALSGTVLAQSSMFDHTEVCLSILWMEDAMISRMAKGGVLASGFQLPHIWPSKTVTLPSHFYSLGSTAPELVYFHWIFSLEDVRRFSLNIMPLVICVFTPKLCDSLTPSLIRNRLHAQT